jgi:hypothetical protein
MERGGAAVEPHMETPADATPVVAPLVETF